MPATAKNVFRSRFVLSAPSGPRGALASSFAADVRRGLARAPKRLPCVHLYDEEGSRLFDAICDLPEYYLTRAERSILAAHAQDIVANLAFDAAFVELGSGSARKTRLLIEAFLRRQRRLLYVPIDVSREMLASSAQELAGAYPPLSVHALVADYETGLRSLPVAREEAKLIAWLGSSIGNLDRDESTAFLREVATRMTATDRLLLGVDLRKDHDALERAYDDAAGVTARFNKNILARINRELAGHFELGRFRHRADYDASLGCVSMHLVSRGAQRVRIDALEMEVDIEAGELIHTESSWKYSPDEIDALAAAAGFAVEERFFDGERRYSVNLLRLALG